MTDDPEQMKELVEQALARPPEERTAFLDEACGADADLRAAVESELAAVERGVHRAGQSEQPGAMVDRYKLLQPLGEGGFGTVWMAEQVTPVLRKVALKVIKLGMDTKQVVARFELERQALAMMNHPNIAKVFDGGVTPGGRPYFVMELVKGTPLTDYCDHHKMTTSSRLELMLSVCAAVQHAHEKGILHRDLKPSNVLVEEANGQPIAKVIDFGLARATDHRRIAATVITEEGQALGTAEYMSPEQAGGGSADVDARADVYSLGAILYELLTGRTPFDSSKLRSAGILEAQRILQEEDPVRPSSRLDTLRDDSRIAEARHHPSVQSLQRQLRGDLDWIVLKALEKDRNRRYPAAASLAEDLSRHLALRPVAARRPSSTYLAMKLVQRHRRGLAVTLALLVAASATVVAINSMQSRVGERDARQLLPKIRERIATGDYLAAFALGEQAERALGDDPGLAALWPEMSYRVTADSAPSGARVSARPIQLPDREPEAVGVTPLSDVRMPRTFSVWEIAKEGHDPMVRTATRLPRITLLPTGTTPRGMVFVDTNTLWLRLNGLSFHPSIPTGTYFLDRFEVTNREYAEFVAAGGYRLRKFWRHEFSSDGKPLSFDAALSRFVDSTGAPGPATWANGTFPEGERDHPVAGVSWYEAAAYSVFRGKSLPTVYHWATAVSPRHAHYYVPLSNFDREATAPVGSYAGINQFGTFDMAGNVREWCFNANSSGHRYILGGAYTDARYMLSDPDARDPFNRSAGNGFRCAKYRADAPPPQAALARIDRKSRDYGSEAPVVDEIFSIYEGLYAYDSRPLRPEISGRSEHEHWYQQTVTIDAAYDDARLPIHLLIPKNSTPPYRAVVYFPGSYAMTADSGLDSATWAYTYVVQHGFLLVCPVYYGTYERRGVQGRPDRDLSEPNRETRFYRDLLIRIGQDVRRTVDFLHSREDIDRDSIAYYGYSWGAVNGPIMLALERRFATAVLLAGGLGSYQLAPEVDPFHFAPRVRTPVLMVNGYHDFFFPVDTSQKRLFDLLGTPVERKEHVVFRDGGHSLVGGKMRSRAIEAIVGWLNRTH